MGGCPQESVEAFLMYSWAIFNWTAENILPVPWTLALWSCFPHAMMSIVFGG